MCQTIVIGATDTNIAYLLQRYAEESGFQTAPVRQSKDVPALVQQLQPVLIILDIELAEAADREVLRQLKADPATCHIPVVIYSCLDEPPEDWTASADGYLFKSLLYDDFIAVLKRASAARANAKGVKPVPETILALEQAAMERWRNGDPWGWAEISDEDVIYVDPGLTSPIVGLEEYKAYLKQIEGQIHYQGSEFIDPKVVVVGDAAVLSYNYRSTVLAPDGSVTDQTPWNATEVYFRRDDQWKIVHTHWSFISHRLPENVQVPIPMQLSPRKFDGVLSEVMALEAAAMERWRKGDPWGFIEISAPDVMYFDTGTRQRIDGREALRAEYAQREGKIFYDVMDFIDPRVQVCGDMAVLTYRFLSTWLNPDGSVSHRTPWNCTEVWTRLGGQWRIIHTHWSFIRGEKS